jgi:membrane associated rhomboid family serine protease
MEKRRLASWMVVALFIYGLISGVLFFTKAAPELFRPISLIVLTAAFGCTFCLYWFSLQKPKQSLPIVTIWIVVVTSLITGLQFVFPEVLSEFRRNGEALLAGEWWRIVTPLFVQADGWRQCCFNGAGAVIFCPLAERLYGKRLLALYFIPGVLGEITGDIWHPNGAGSSLGIAGVIGSLFAFAFLRRREVSVLASIFAVFGFTGTVALCYYRDVHGPPMLIGVLLGSIITMWPNTALEPTPTAP